MPTNNDVVIAVIRSWSEAEKQMLRDNQITNPDIIVNTIFSSIFLKSEYDSAYINRNIAGVNTVIRKAVNILINQRAQEATRRAQEEATRRALEAERQAQARAEAMRRAQEVTRRGERETLKTRFLNKIFSSWENMENWIYRIEIGSNKWYQILLNYLEELKVYNYGNIFEDALKLYGNSKLNLRSQRAIREVEKYLGDSDSYDEEKILNETGLYEIYVGFMSKLKNVIDAVDYGCRPYQTSFMCDGEYQIYYGFSYEMFERVFSVINDEFSNKRPVRNEVIRVLGTDIDEEKERRKRMKLEIEIQKPLLENLVENVNISDSNGNTTKEFTYTNNNILIQFTMRSNGWLYLDYLVAQNDNELPPAPKGLARYALCELLKYFKRVGFNGKRITDRTQMALFPAQGSIGARASGQSHNTQKLRQMYMQMGFKNFSRNNLNRRDELKSSVGEVLRWCKTYVCKIDYNNYWFPMLD